MDKITDYVEIFPNPNLEASIKDKSVGVNFFNAWVASLKFIHELPPKQMLVFAAFLKWRHYISTKVNLEDKDIDELVLQNKYRKKVGEELNMSLKYVNVVVDSFRKHGVVECMRDENGRIVKGKQWFYKNLIPTIDKDGVRLIINFRFQHEWKPVKLDTRKGSKNP